MPIITGTAIDTLARVQDTGAGHRHQGLPLRHS
jgi:hypothetical protein